MKFTKVAILFSLALFSLAACEKEGPAERAGKKIDNAVENAKNAADDAAEKLGNKAEELGDKIQKKTN